MKYHAMAKQYLLLIVLCLLLLVEAGVTSQHSRQIAQDELELFGFSSGSQCYQATGTVLNSIPFSCHSALGEWLRASGAPPLVIAALRLDHMDRELCQTYCSYPLRQAGEDCQQLHHLYQALSGACLTNINGTMCLHFQSLMDTLRDDCNVTMTTNCTQQCSDNQKEAEKSMGCCLATLLSVTQTSSPCPLPSSQVCSSAHRLSKLLPSLLPLILVTIATNMN